ncbi:hypothetical protein PALB_36470 [Pseudoalteromonas luteoviolacea B = ATCC 29581]|nr:hypothetical protein PALB_36470 [Pseudoalteromonas luteoviolacea B = ATCC 29581]
MLLRRIELSIAYNAYRLSTLLGKEGVKKVSSERKKAPTKAEAFLKQT